MSKKKKALSKKPAGSVKKVAGKPTPAAAKKSSKPVRAPSKSASSKQPARPVKSAAGKKSAAPSRTAAKSKSAPKKTIAAAKKSPSKKTTVASVKNKPSSKNSAAAKPAKSKNVTAAAKSSGKSTQAAFKKTEVSKSVSRNGLAPSKTNGVSLNGKHDAKIKGESKSAPSKSPTEKTVSKQDAPKAQAVKEAPAAKTKQADSASQKDNRAVLAITNTIPAKVAAEISPSRIATISSSITNPVKRTESYSVRPEKEPAGKFEMEFVVHASAEMLYEFLSTPSGLSEWFCDDLNIRNGIYTFIWEDQLQQARLLKTVDLQLVRFQWVDKTDGSYFEFRIQRDDLTNDISVIITDFADTHSERESAKLLWNSQFEKLRHVIGAIF